MVDLLPPTEERPAGLTRRVLARLAAACFFLTGVAALLIAHADGRALVADRAITAAEAATDEETKAAFLATARARLRGGLNTSGLSVATARVTLLGAEPDYDRAERRLVSALQGSPARASVWALLAEARAARAGFADDSALEALQTSFLVATFGGPELRRRRLAFVLGYWDDLDRSLQRAGMRQVAALGASREDEQWARGLLADTPPGPAREAFARALDRADIPYE